MSQTDALQTGDIIRRVFEVVGGNLRQLGTITIIVYIPLLLLLLGLMGTVDLTTEGQAADAAASCWVAILGIVGAILTQVQAGAFAFGIFEALRGRPIEVGKSLRVAAGRLIHMIFAAILVALCVMGGLILLVVPGIVAAVGLSVVVPVVVVERRGTLDSLKRSWDLTTGHKWRIFVLGVLWVLVSMVVAVLLAFTELNEIWIEQLLNMGLSLFSATAITLIYHDLRQIKDGLGTEDLVAVFE